MVISFVKKGQTLFILSFLSLVGGGTLLLKLPWSHSGELDWVDAYFTATSSVCVTGLTSVPISQFTEIGQGIVLLLIQLGGIGIMTLSASILLAIGRGLSFSDTLLISSLSDNFSLRGTEGLTRTVVHFVLFTETVGVVLLFPAFLMEYPWHEALWYSVFHAVSAFCNAGISPFDDSLADCGRWIQFVVAGLVILGGLGVYVIYDIQQFFRRRQLQLRLHSKVVISMSFILLVGGTLLFLLIDRHMAWQDAFFLSAVSRTAGFSTIPIGELRVEILAIVIILMLIGGAPGSTAGGMKVSTFAVAIAAIFSTYKGSAAVQMFGRTIPNGNVMRSYTIIVTFILLNCAGAIFLHLLTPKQFAMMECFFESASAISTTGLSTGATGSLTFWGKVYLALYMFLGRVGPFTIMLFLLGREQKRHLRYPEERVIIG